MNVTKNHIKRINDDDGKYITDPEKIAKQFNKYFIGLTNNNNTKCKNTNKKSILTSIFLKPFGVNEIEEIIMSLNNTNAVGPDEITTKVLKYCKKELAPILAYLINESFYLGLFPGVLKLSVVKPLHKKNSTDQLSNYRPITLVSVMSKIFEKAYYKRLIDFTNKLEILRPEQYGFRSKKSTTQACYDLVDHIIKNLNDRRIMVTIFIDMSKAFDFVSHKILLSKLENLGIRGPALKWVESFLTTRMQCVEIETTNENNEIIKVKSNYKTNKYGVPQGSILGPLLFLFYINDLPDITTHKMTLFADDISISLTYNNIDIRKFEFDINHALTLLIEWLESNNLQINISKTSFIQFRNYNKKPLKLNINFKGKQVQEVEKCRFLGLQIDEHCSWKFHIENVCHKLNRFVHVLRRLMKTVSTHTALTAYHGYVSSVLRYGLIIWGNSTMANRAFIIQKKCLRAIHGIAPYISCKPSFTKFRILPLPCIYILEIAKFVKMNRNLFTSFRDVQQTRSARNPDRLIFTTLPRTNLFSKNCHAMAIKLFNKLPSEIRSLPIKYFAQRLKLWLQRKNFYSLEEFYEHDKKRF